MSAKAVQKLKDKIDEQKSQIKSLIEQKDEKIDSAADTAAETKSELEDAKSKLLNLEEDLGEMKGRLDEWEAKNGRPGFGEGGEEQKSLGEMFVESDEFKGADRGSPDVKFEAEVPDWEQKDLDSSSDSTRTLSSIIRPDRVAQIKAPRLREPRMRDVLNTSQTESNMIEFVEESGFANLVVEMSKSASAGDTTLDVDNANGFYTDQSVNIDPDGDDEDKVVSSTTVNEDGQDTITLKNGLDSAKSAGDLIESESFDGTPEGNLKPSQDIDFDVKQVSVVTIAHTQTATRQILDDEPRARDFIDGRGTRGLMIAEEDMILYGQGTTGESFTGFMIHSDVPTFDQAADGQTGDTKYDTVRRAKTVARLANYPVNALVLNPNDWEDIELTKDSNGNYVYLNIEGGETVWRIPVVETQAIDPGEALIGAFDLGAEMFLRRDVTVRMHEDHDDYAKRNLVLFVIEERATMAIYRPEAFVKIIFS